MDAPQNWVGYDYLKADVYTDAKDPLELTVEVRDRETRDYWTRVNYTTVVPPGASTLIIPTALYVGEKSRPGRPLLKEAVTRLVFSIGDKPAGAALPRQPPPGARHGDGDRSYSTGCGPSTSAPPAAPSWRVSRRSTPARPTPRPAATAGRTPISGGPSTPSSPTRSTTTFICVESGGLAIDVPNGKYHVFVNMDSPSGYWGEFQRYRKRALILNGERHEDTMDLESFKKRYLPLLGQRRPAIATTPSTSIRSRISARSSTTSRSATAS